MDNKKKPSKKKKFNIKDMGINFDKNEYKEIVQSNSNHPYDSFMKKI